MTWTRRDTEICEKAEKSGMAINVKTNAPVTEGELDKLAEEYDKVRSKMSVDEFLKGKTKSIPFEF